MAPHPIPLARDKPTRHGYGSRFEWIAAHCRQHRKCDIAIVLDKLARPDRTRVTIYALKQGLIRVEELP